MMKTFLLMLIVTVGWGKVTAQYGAVAEVLDLPYWPEVKVCAAYKLDYTTLHGKGTYIRSQEAGLRRKVEATYTADTASGGYVEHIDSLYEYTDLDHYRIRTSYKLGLTEHIKTIVVAHSPGGKTVYRNSDDSEEETCVQHRAGKTRIDSCFTKDKRQRLITYYNDDGLLHRREKYKSDASGNAILLESVQREYVRDELKRVKKVTEAHYHATGQEYTFNYYYIYDTDKVTIIKFTDGVPLKQKQLVLRKDSKGYLNSFEHTIITTEGKIQTKVIDSQGIFSCP